MRTQVVAIFSEISDSCFKVGISVKVSRQKKRSRDIIFFKRFPDQLSPIIKLIAGKNQCYFLFSNIAPDYCPEAILNYFFLPDPSLLSFS